MLATAGAVASLSVGATSDGLRGVVFGLVLPAACIFVVGLVTDLLVALVAGGSAAFLGVWFALRIGSNLDSQADAVINLTPLLSGVAILVGAALGSVCGILLRPGRR